MLTKLHFGEKCHRSIWFEHLYKSLQASINEIEMKIFTEERKIPVFKNYFSGSFTAKRIHESCHCPDLIDLEFENLDTAIKELEMS